MNPYGADNLLLTADQKSVKLADFGLAREETVTEMMTAETGTYRWMAPEVSISLLSEYLFLTTSIYFVLKNTFYTINLDCLQCLSFPSRISEIQSEICNLKLAN